MVLKFFQFGIRKKKCSTSKVGPCTFFVVRKQSNHLWPQSRGNTDTSAPLCKRKVVGGCASVVKTKVFDAFKTKPTSCNAPISSSNIKINSSFEAAKGVNRPQNEDPKVVPCHPRNLIHNAQLSHSMRNNTVSVQSTALKKFGH